MKPGDIPAVAALERQCFSQPWSEASLQTGLENPGGVFLVATEQDALAGYVGMYRVLDEGYIANVAVDSRFRRQGVASRLVEELAGFARQERMAFLTLEVRESNAPAIGLYRKHGFGEAGRRKGFYANPLEDAILMTIYL